MNGGGVDRVLIVDAGVAASLSHLIVTNGFGFQIAGGILNSGDLTLDHVTVTGNVMTTDAVDFWQGGGGIYNGEGATLNLLDSTVADNVSDAPGAGIYAFFNTEVIVQRSTISGNVSQDVGGGFRTLGNLVIDNSTVSGNQSMEWHGGAGFLTDGTTTVSNSTVVNNTAPPGTTGGFFIGTFSDASATLNLVNNIIAFNGDVNCFAGFFGGGPVSLNSLGHNLITDGSANPVASDLIVADPWIGILSDNGGPTQTHALLTGSPAIDAANPAYSPAIDQRSVSRDAVPDIGSYEYIP